MSWDRRVVRVCGVPGHLFEEGLLSDKLWIHFLRPKNQGGEIQDLRYPTKEKGVAMVTFEEEKVAGRILQTRHSLDVNGQSFPLEVMRPQFSMPVVTSLDLDRIVSEKLLKALMEKHRIRGLSRSHHTLTISAEFKDLQRFRSEMMAKDLICNPSPLGKKSRNPTTVQGAESPMKDVKPSNQQPSGLENPQSPRTPNSTRFHEKHPRGRRREANMAPTFSNADSLRDRLTASSIDSVVQGSGEGGTSFKPTRDPKVRINDDSVPQMLRDLNLGSSTTTDRGRPSGEASGTTRRPSAVAKDFPSERSLVRSFHVDKDVLYYVRVIEKEYVEGVLRRCFVDMEVTDDEDICYVTLKAQFPLLKTLFEDCHGTISQLFIRAQDLLRTEDVDLTQFSPSARREIADKVKDFGRAQRVAIVTCKDALHLIGGSHELHVFKEWWKTVSCARAPDADREVENTAGRHLPHPPNMGRSYAGTHEKSTNQGEQDVTPTVRRRGSVPGSPQTVRQNHQSGGKHESKESSSAPRTRTNSKTRGMTHPNPNR
ncbi:hypothetical protein XENTR_v10015696 [Xenopus tropicalis]|uniref:RNA-binding protein 43 n=1 Tax=Xenopus tropicalis TaxID=8364 RepID=A0A8J1JR20_XENTR|nr:RNA-binding protein 43 [Xenopus tropicalis]KAE8595330.1 hypothetical protein XENTR_v10015696 [Xenopus tropicalis]KAE8595331.1 hypothetical protein XENTR_v10015696 [Xenopus tropicalis]KAE8595332.1 hypothetical protein XENTR_v10015696 [Xenopus tropicalis]KAE8595333.1 hypothetical protein XENTR_v10015696 [Xenopus tropicalis]KAE8595334.1 hypothetical protein XENTR_v10015696 [Xenopus tropicalis]